MVEILKYTFFFLVPIGLLMVIRKELATHHRKKLHSKIDKFFSLVRGEDCDGSRERFINEFIEMSDNQWDEFVDFMNKFPEHPFIKDPPSWKSKEKDMINDLGTLRIFHKY